jgi:putative N6-adenine-specific DNA methylase
VDSLELFATAAKGTEPALRDELRELRFRGVRADRGGVHFAGPIEDGWRACLESRVAVRVLRLLGRFPAPHADALYQGVAAVDWSELLGPERTLAVRAACRSSALTHTQFISQKTKDAVVDQLRARHGARPSVDLSDPDVGIFVHVVRDEAAVYVDLAGEPLHRRGYRRAARSDDNPLLAPIKETLAAAVVRLSGWDRVLPLADPMCGSGTLAIEAAQWARGMAPGLGRPRFGFQRWASHDAGAAERFTELRERVRAKARAEGPPVLASDVDPAALEATRAAAQAAGVKLEVRHAGIGELGPTTPPGVVVINPPYGARLPRGEGLVGELAGALRGLDGHRAAVIAPLELSDELIRAMRMRYDRTLSLFNGDIECRLITWDIRSGGGRA